MKSVRRQTRSLSNNYWLRDHLRIAASGGDALPLTGTALAEHQTCSAQLVFLLFVFGVPPLKALQGVASSKSGTHGTPLFTHQRISIPLAPFHSVNLQRERTRQIAPDLRRSALTHRSRGTRHGRFYGSSQRGAPFTGYQTRRFPPAEIFIGMSVFIYSWTTLSKS